MKLETAFQDRANAFGLLRLVLAATVILSHVWPLGGFGDDPGEINGMNLGRVAVCGFFALSGFLIARSAERSNLKAYGWHRFLRIVPAYLVCLAVVAFGFAAVGYHHQHGDLTGFFSHQFGPWQYLWFNADLHVTQSGVSGTPSEVPHADTGPVWNGPLYTLGLEVNCYLALALFTALGVLRRAKWVIPALALLFCVIGALPVDSPVWQSLFHLPWAFGFPYFFIFGQCFFVGSALWLYADRIPVSPLLGLIALAVSMVAWNIGAWKFIGGPFLTYGLIWLATVLPARTIGRRCDLSYGLYLYGFPVLQLLATFDLQRFGLIPYGGAALAGAAVLAACSWYAIERPALKLKNKGPGADASSCER